MRRNQLIQVKFSREEKEKIKAEAARLGMWPAQYVRAVGVLAKYTDEEIRAAIQADREAAIDSRLCVASA